MLWDKITISKKCYVIYDIVMLSIFSHGSINCSCGGYICSRCECFMGTMNLAVSCKVAINYYVKNDMLISWEICMLSVCMLMRM